MKMDPVLECQSTEKPSGFCLGRKKALFPTFFLEKTLHYQETSAGQRWEKRRQESSGSAIASQALGFPASCDSGRVECVLD